MMEWNFLCKSKTGKRKVISKVTIMCLILTSFIMSFLGCATQNTNMEVIPMGAIDAHESIDLRGKTITTYIIYYTIEKLQQMEHTTYQEYTVQKIAELRISSEGQEGINAFLEKRKPRWRNK